VEIHEPQQRAVLHQGDARSSPGTQPPRKAFLTRCVQVRVKGGGQTHQGQQEGEMDYLDNIDGPIQPNQEAFASEREELQSRGSSREAKVQVRRGDG